MPKLTGAVLVILGAAALLFAAYANWTDIVTWVQGEQQAMQTELAKAIQAVRLGDQFAIATLVSACFIYGLLHAIGPGHGKFLIGGAAVASRRTAWRMATIGFASSLMQALSAIVLAYGGLGLLSATGGAIIGSANGLLMQISFTAMALVGAWIILRGVRLMAASPPGGEHEHHAHSHSDHAHAHDHDHERHHGHHGHHHSHSGQCASGCKHMPTVDEAEKIESWRDIAALVLSIGIRPCSGALIVLIISWHLGLHAVGALGTVAMAVGTGVVVGLVAIFATTVRDSGFFRLSGDGAISMASFGRLQVLAGTLVVAVCVALMISGASSSAPTGLVR